MKLKHPTPFPIYFLAFFISTFTCLSSVAQTTETEIQDSVITVGVPIAEIPTEMVQTRIKTVKLLDDNIETDGLAKKGAENDILLADIKNHLTDIKETTRETKSIRYLENRKLQLKIQEDNLDKISDEFSAIINNLDNAAIYFRKEKKRWNATKDELDKNNYSTELLIRIDKLNLLLDSALNVVSERTESIFKILEKNALVSIEIEDLLSNLNQLSKTLESKLLKTDRPSIFNLDYSEENVTFKKDIAYYIKGVRTDLKIYFQDKKTELYILLVIFIILVYFGYKNKEKLTNMGQNGKSYYQRKFALIFAEPINASLLLILVLSTVIFRERPLAFRDVLGFLMIIPLLRVTYLVVSKDFHKYINWTVLLIFPLIIYLVFPPENVFFRFNLVFIAICELFITLRLYQYVKTIDEETRQLNKKILLPASMVFIVFSAIGLFASIIGNVLLAQIVLFSNYYSIIGGAVLYSTSIILNGSILTILDNKYLKKINAITKYNHILSRRFVHIINILASLNWLLIIASQLKIKGPVSNAIIDFIEQERTLGAVTFNIGDILIFILVIYISNFIAKIIQVFLEDDILNKMPLPKGLPHSIGVLVRYAIITAGIMLAISSAGVSMNNLTVILSAFGVGIGFGLQNIFNNLVSGLILLFERPVQIGDTVEIGTLVGKVNHIGIRSSNIRTFDGAEVIVPNGNLISSELINWTLSDSQRRTEIIVGVSYDSNPEQVIEILINILKEHPLILTQPEPAVYFQELGDSSLNFRTLFWVYSYNDWQKIKSEVTTRIFNDLTSNGIEIPFPQRDIHIRSFQDKLDIEQNKVNDILE